MGFRATGKLDMVQQTARADGTHVLRVWAEVQRPGMNGQLQNESVLLEVWLDAAGKPTIAQRIGEKNADLADLERQIDKF